MIKREHYYSDQQWEKYLQFSQNIETPCIIIDLDIIKKTYQEMVTAFPYAKVYYAMKANPSNEIIKLLRDLGSSFDVASVNEQHQLLSLGVSPDIIGTIFGLGSALSFGISTPLAKVLIGQIQPVMLAGLMYLGGGLGLAAIQAVRQLNKRPVAPFSRKDWGWLMASILSGGILAPLLLMFSLTYTSASTASLLLNFDGVFTALLAWSIFQERLQIPVLFGIIAITAGATVLCSQEGYSEFGLSWGAFLILGTCFFWALDSNLTNKVSGKDAIQVAMLKSMVAGFINIAIALTVGQTLPPVLSFLAVCVVGFFTYGINLLCFVLELRYMGASRTGAFLALSPFIGVAFSVLFLEEEITRHFEIAALLMAIGVGFCLIKGEKNQSKAEI